MSQVVATIENSFIKFEMTLLFLWATFFIVSHASLLSWLSPLKNSANLETLPRSAMVSIHRHNDTPLRHSSRRKVDPAIFEHQIEAFIASVFTDAHAEISALAPDSAKHADCIREALQDLLPKCLGFTDGKKQPLAFTLSDEERRKYSIALSICQFKAAYMEFPTVCDVPMHTTISSNSIKPCLIKLHSNPQWWTTFNGYYQSVGSLCLEQANSFQSDRILSLYQDMTTMQEGLLRHVQVAVAELMKQHQDVSNTAELVAQVRTEVEAQVQSVQAQISNILAVVAKDAADHLEIEFNHFVTSITGSLTNAVTDLVITVQEASKQSTESLAVAVDDLAIKIGDGIVQFQNELETTLDDIGDQFSQLVSSADELTQSHHDLKDLQDNLSKKIGSSIVSYLFLFFFTCISNKYRNWLKIRFLPHLTT